MCIEQIANIYGEIKCSEKCRQVQFLEILEGTYREENYEHFFLRGGYVQAVFVSIEDMSSEDKICRTQLLRNFFKENNCHIFYYREFAVLLFENTPEPAVRKLLENLYGYLMKNNYWCVITLGSLCRTDSLSPGMAIRETCQEAEKIMDNIFFFSDKKILALDDMQNKKSEKDLDIDEEAKKLCSYIQIVDHKKIMSFFHSLEEYFLHSGKSPQEIRQECMTLMIEVRSDLNKKFSALRKMFGTGREIIGGILKKRYLKLVIETMTEASLRISEALPLLSADSSFKRIISYVNNNYYENLRLETLAWLFNYNCAYLGKCFKKNTGKNFHTYLDTLRIDTAKEMLRNTGMKVYEISNAVGYANTDCFYGKFRKYTGKSPLVFRKN
jgi:YesN/AraC family two-component response regulator